MTLRIATIDGGGVADVDLGAADDDYLARVVPEAQPAAAGWWRSCLVPRAIAALAPASQPRGQAMELWTEESEPWLNLD